MATVLPTNSNTGPSLSTDAFFELVYEELRRVASGLMVHEQPGHTLSATALVSETYVRLKGSSSRVGWDSRSHFFSAAAETMRCILIDRARAKSTQKRKATRQQVELDSIGCTDEGDLDWLLELNEVIEQLQLVDPQAAQFVKLRLFGGQSVVEAGKLLGLSKWSAYQLWEFSLSWFAVNYAR
jgi:RNA polymerase sigma factor (TIGR02999 family)